MDAELKCGSMISIPKPLRTSKTRAGLGTSLVLEDPTTCMLITPTLNGGSCSNQKESSLSILKTERFLMLLEEKMKKVTTFKSGRKMAQRHSNGLLSMKTRRRRIKPRV